MRRIDAALTICGCLLWLPGALAIWLTDGPLPLVLIYGLLMLEAGARAGRWAESTPPEERAVGEEK